MRAAFISGHCYSPNTSWPTNNQCWPYDMTRQIPWQVGAMRKFMRCFFDMCCVLSTRSLSCFRTDFYHDWLLSKRNKLHFFAFIMADFYHSYILIFNTMSTTMIMKRKVCSCGYNFIYMYIYWLLILFMNHMDKRNVDWCIPFCIYKEEPSKP